MTQTVASVLQLTRRFGDFTAVDAIDFEIRRREIFGFLGPNGSGKTTTIRMMLGLLEPTAGTVNILGINAANNGRKLRHRIGYMSQRFSLYNDLTVMQNLAFYGKAYGLSNTLLKERIGNALEMSGLVGREHSLTRDLAGGWRQRLALSAAILHRPEVLFLDEPTAGVDPVSRRAFWDLLYQLVHEGVTVFVTTHYMDEAEHCHRLAFIQRGRIIAYGEPDAIKRDMMPGDVLELEPNDPIRAVDVLRRAAQSGEIDIREVELYGTLVHVIAPDAERKKRRITTLLKKERIDPGRMDIIPPTLEDVFIACMQ